VRSGATPHGAPAQTFTPVELSRLYQFPPDADGSGQCIAIIELGGGFRSQDLDRYFSGLGIPRPQVTAISVDGKSNAPTGNPNGPDGEVVLDIEVAGGVAPGAQIAVYFAPNTNKGFLDAVKAAIHDSVRKPSVISISWGGPEDGGGFSRATLNAFEQAFRAAAVMGVTVFAAAGDNGSSDGMPFGDHVDHPACSPGVCACGGTSLQAPDKKTIISETVWNDDPKSSATGGGVSVVFDRPGYQAGLQVRKGSSAPTPLAKRGVPDVAAVVDPNTGYSVLVDGDLTTIGGTSAVAPLMAGLVARLNQKLGQPVGFLNPVLYRLLEKPGVFRDVTKGNNGTYTAGPGWDACTGVGVPVGTALLAALQGKPAPAVAEPAVSATD
jgi:kumamolisin